MDLINKKDNGLVFKGKVSDSLANALRRYVYQIEIVAVDEVEISKNDSPLYDETIAHRIGLIPLKQNKKNGTMNLKAKKEGFVYSGGFEGDISPVYDGIPITLLSKDQEIALTATTKAGKGSEHSKYSPGLFFYRDVLEISLDKVIADKVSQIVSDVKVENKGGKTVVVDDGEKPLADVCEGLAEKEGKKIEFKPTGEVVFSIESFGQIKPEDIFLKSIVALRKDLDEVAKKLK